MGLEWKTAGDPSSGAESQGKGKRRAGVPQDVQEALLELSHDIRHSVGTILMLVDGGRHQARARSESARLLDGIEFEADSIAALCRAVLGGAAEDRQSRVDQLVRRVVEATTSSFDTTIDLTVEPASVTGNELALVRLLRNLLNNACRAAGPDGRVSIRVRQMPGMVWIQVCDSGPGFGKIEPLEGLGLAIVQSAAQALRGCVTVEEGSSGGTEIVVTFPTNETAPSPGDERADGNPDVTESLT